jgi:hypothetical protein
MRAFIAGIAVLVAAGAAAATDRKVPSTDYPTLDDAAAAAVSGDRILVAKGYYQATVTVNGDDIQIVGKGATWDAAEAAVAGVGLIVNGNNAVITGFTFINGNDQVRIVGNGARITKCVFLSSTENGIDILGNDSLVSGCRFIGSGTEAVLIGGDLATVEKCKFNNMDAGAVDIAGNDCLVQKNWIQTVEDDDGIYISGVGARVLKNKLFNIDGGLYVSGVNSIVEGNVVAYCGDTAIDVNGNNATIRKNRVSFISDDSSGFDVTSTGGLIEGNTATDIASSGFYLSVANATILKNSAQRAGSESEDGFVIIGSGNTVEANKAKDIDDCGFFISGSNNYCTKNTAQNCGGDGFNITTGSDNVLDNCSAKGSVHEGLDNSGTNTDVIGGTYTGNRIDIADDGSFDLFENVKYVTGGQGFPPQLD